jgi:hypothetical protein
MLPHSLMSLGWTKNTPLAQLQVSNYLGSLDVHSNNISKGNQADLSLICMVFWLLSQWGQKLENALAIDHYSKTPY